MPLPSSLRRISAPGVALALTLTSGCTDLTQARNDGERLDQRFHIVLSQGGLKDIYPQAEPEFRKATTEAQANALFNAVLRKLGTPVSSQQISWRLNATTSGTYLVSVSKTEFSKQAQAEEMFTWKKGADSVYRLAAYNIRSNDLITR